MSLPSLPPWALMWLVALALYVTAKAATFAAAGLHWSPLPRRLAYLFLFPGMNAAAFCSQHPHRPPPTSPALTTGRSTINILAGALFFWGIARLVPPDYPLLRGWIGMLGMILLLHFGLLQLICRAWQAAGRDAPPIMNQPFSSASLTEFWSLRWNTAFRQLSHQFLFKPLARRTTPRAALLLTFAISGLVHDLVISVPARAGFGLPTLYFLLQAAALLFERTRTGRRLLRRPLTVRFFTIAVVTLPAPLLFHPPFVTRIILPFMTAAGALPTGAHL